MPFFRSERLDGNLEAGSGTNCKNSLPRLGLELADGDPLARDYLMVLAPQKSQARDREFRSRAWIQQQFEISWRWYRRRSNWSPDERAWLPGAWHCSPP